MINSPPTTPPRSTSTATATQQSKKRRKKKVAVLLETPSHPGSPADSQLDGGEYGMNGDGDGEGEGVGRKVGQEEEEEDVESEREREREMEKAAIREGVTRGGGGGGWFSTIRLAPLHIPLYRRLETLAVLWHELALGLCLTVFWSLLANPFLWPLLIPYLLHLLLSSSHHNGSSPYIRSSPLRSWRLWRFYNAFFPITIHRTAKLDPTGNYIFGYQPHGIISIGAWGAFVTEDPLAGLNEAADDHQQDTDEADVGYKSAPGGGWNALFPGIRNTLLTLDGNFRIPLYREYLLSMGLASVSRKSCEALLGGSYPDKHPLPPQYYTTSPTAPASTPSRIVAWICRFPPLALALHILHLLTSLLPAWLPSSLHPHLPHLPTRHPSSPPPPSQTGNAITIVLGGAHESLLTLPHTYRLILRRRRGFLKLALRSSPRTPTALVPVLAFGENDLYTTLIPARGSTLDRAQRLLKRWLGFTVPVFWARGVFNYDVGLVPFRRRVDVVVGRPVLPRRFREAGGGEGVGGSVRGREVTEEEVDELQEEYIAELQRLWHEWKDVFAKGRKGELEIVE